MMRLLLLLQVPLGFLLRRPYVLLQGLGSLLLPLEFGKLALKHGSTLSFTGKKGGCSDW
jgi:hypothetical protein